MSPKLVIIVAALKPKYGIGHNGKMPWRLKQEMAYFRETTVRAPPGHINAVLMGSTTWESIPQQYRPLPGRINAVLSRKAQNTVDPDSVVRASSVDAALRLCQEHASALNRKLYRVFVMGGAQVYNALVHDPRVSHLLITEISCSGEQPEMDTYLYFPLDREWQQMGHQELQEFVAQLLPQRQVENKFQYEFQLWQRKGGNGDGSSVLD